MDLKVILLTMIVPSLMMGQLVGVGIDVITSSYTSKENRMRTVILALVVVLTFLFTLSILFKMITQYVEVLVWELK